MFSHAFLIFAGGLFLTRSGGVLSIRALGKNIYRDMTFPLSIRVLLALVPDS